MITAEEFLRDKLVHFKVDTQGVRPDWDVVAVWMNEYAVLKAKHYVTLALEAAADNAEVKEQLELNYEWSHSVDKNSILDSFSVGLIT
jgi:hypothetical protein